MSFPIRGFARSLVMAGLVLLAICNPLLAQPSKKKALQRERTRAEAGAVEGAIWAFQLTPTTGGPKLTKLIGRYRISDLVVYQAEEVGGEFNIEVGKSKPNEKTKATVVDFEFLRAKNADREWQELKGKAILSPKKLDYCEGEFTDSNGVRWKMSATRVRE